MYWIKLRSSKAIVLFQGTAVGCIINHLVMAYATYVWQLYVGKKIVVTDWRSNEIRITWFRWQIICQCINAVNQLDAQWRALDSDSSLHVKALTKQEGLNVCYHADKMVVHLNLTAVKKMLVTSYSVRSLAF